MFGRLFGKKKKKIDPEEQKRLDKLKKEKNLKLLILMKETEEILKE